MTARAGGQRGDVQSLAMAWVSGILAGGYWLASAPSRPSTWSSVLWVALISLAVLAAWAAARALLARRGRDVRLEAGRRVAIAWVLGSLLLAAYAPIYWLAGDHPALAPWVRWYVPVVGVLLAASCLAAQFRAQYREPLPRRHGHVVLAALLVGYVISGSAANAYRWQTFSLGNVDSAIVVQSLRNTLEGGPLFFNTIEKASHLGVHSSPIYFLLLPLYALLRSPSVFLIALPPLAIGLSGIPFQRLARTRLGAAPALFLTAAYLLSPYIAARSTGDLYEMTLLPLVLLPAIYAFDQHKMGPFLCFAVLCLSVKESIAATMLMFGLLGLIQRRRWPWVVAPVLLASLSLYLSYAILMPAFGGDAVASRTAALLGDLGETPQAILRFAVTDPVGLGRKVLTLPKLALFYQLYQPLLFALPWLSPEALLAVPALGLNLLAQGGSIGVRAWESAIFGPLLFASAAGGIQAFFRRLRLLGKGQEARRRWEMLLAMGVFFGTLACAPYWVRVEEIAPRPYLYDQRQAVAMVRSDASVSAPDYMMARFAESEHLQLQTGAPFWADYHIVDTRWIDSLRGHRVSEQAAQDYARLVSQATAADTYQGLRLLWAGDGIYVYRREE